MAIGSPLELTLGTEPILKVLTKIRRRAGRGESLKFWRRVMVEETVRLKNALQLRIAAEGPIGVTREYRNKIGAQVIGFGFNLLGVVEHDNVDHAVIVNDGRRPGQTPPPAQDLVPWMNNVMDLTDENGETLDAGEVEDLAVVIASLIGERGTFQPGQESLRGQQGPGMHQFERTMTAERPKILRRVQRRLIAYFNFVVGR